MSAHVALADGVMAAKATLMRGDVFAGLAVEDADSRGFALKALLAEIVDDGTRVVWVGNPLRSPLTIERFLLQIVGPEVDLRIERGPAELAALIAARKGSETRLLIVVQQPETINPETLDQLGLLAGHLGGEAVQVQFLLVGSPALRLPTPARAVLAPLRLSSPGDRALDEADAPVPPRRHEVVPLLILLLAVSLGVVFTLARPSHDAAPLLAPLTPIADAAPAPPARESLRQLFDEFLAARAATLPPLSEAQKDALFAEFMAQRSREAQDHATRP